MAIPIPTTGAWTGCIAATLLKLDYKNALLVILSGVFTAGLIVSTISYQIFGKSPGTLVTSEVIIDNSLILVDYNIPLC